MSKLFILILKTFILILVINSFIFSMIQQSVAQDLVHKMWLFYQNNVTIALLF